MVTQFWLAEKYLRVFCVMRRLIMKPVVVHPQGDAPSSIQDDFVEDPKLLRPVLGGLKITYIPKWINQHDSFYLPEKLLNERVNDFSGDPVPLQSYTVCDRIADRRKAFRVRLAHFSLFQHIRRIYDYAVTHIAVRSAMKRKRSARRHRRSYSDD